MLPYRTVHVTARTNGTVHKRASKLKGNRQFVLFEIIFLRKDERRIPYAKSLLFSLLRDPRLPPKIPLLIFGNKIDLFAEKPKIEDIQQNLGLYSVLLFTKIEFYQIFEEFALNKTTINIIALYLYGEIPTHKFKENDEIKRPWNIQFSSGHARETMAGFYDGLNWLETKKEENTGCIIM